MVHLQDESSHEQYVALNLIVVYSLCYSPILGIAWITWHNQEIMWRKRKWYSRAPADSDAGPIQLQYLFTFITRLRAKEA